MRDTYNALMLDKPLIQQEDGDCLYSAPPRKQVVAYGVGTGGAPFKVEAPGFPDVTQEELAEIFGRPATNELSAKEELAFDLGWDAFLSGRVDDSLEGLKLLGWKAAKEHFEGEVDVERELFAQTIERF